MDLDLTEDQESIRDVFADFFSSETGPEQAREAEPLGFDSRAWDRLLETGAPGMGVAESSGGGGANLADLAVVVEEAGAHIAALPLVDHMVTTRLLARVGACDDDVLAGTTIVGLAIRPPQDGTARTVPSGAVAQQVVASTVMPSCSSTATLVPTFRTTAACRWPTGPWLGPPCWPRVPMPPPPTTWPWTSGEP
jgi:hypothetical protein